jgi:hypothetical protein
MKMSSEDASGSGEDDGPHQDQ